MPWPRRPSRRCPSTSPRTAPSPFRLYGKLTPKANKKTAILQRAGKANGHYGKFKTTKTDKQGKYNFTGLKKEGFYKVKIGKATSKVIHVCKGGCG